jgi:phosphoribosylaminoimidazole-succinocarboxamide synthase
LEIKKNDKAFLDTMNLIDKEAVFRYEHLRSYSGMSGRHSRERELFVQKGLFSWMETWARYTKPLLGCSEKTDPQGISVHKELLAEGINPQVIDIVAEMAMAVYGGTQA